MVPVLHGRCCTDEKTQRWPHWRARSGRWRTVKVLWTVYVGSIGNLFRSNRINSSKRTHPHPGRLLLRVRNLCFPHIKQSRLESGASAAAHVWVCACMRACVCLNVCEAERIMRLQSCVPIVYFSKLRLGTMYRHKSYVT